jgi:hypothetical protein
LEEQTEGKITHFIVGVYWGYIKLKQKKRIGY